MPILKRKDIPDLLKKAEKGKTSQIYLILGERFLIREAADDLVAVLLPDGAKRANHLHSIDGDQEDVRKTLGMLRTYSLFSGRQVIRVIDSKIFHSKGIARTLWKKAAEAGEAKDFTAAGRYLAQMLDIDGAARITAEELESLSAKRWKDLFGFARPQDKISWLTNALDPDKTPPAQADKPADPGDVAELYIKAFTDGIPADNILILTAEAVDKRKRFYKFIKDNGVILDLSVEAGGSAAARREQDAVLTELIDKTLAGFNKQIDAKAREILLERVGFHPVAVVLETEKLALYTGDAPKITTADVDDIIGLTREEALFELTDALTRKQIQRALFVLTRLRENGIHALAIIASLRNHFRKLIIIRSWQSLAEPAYSPSLPFPAFQKNYLPDLKKDRDEWGALWSGHPYALYMLFQQAGKYEVTTLSSCLSELLDAEYRLKSSGVPGDLILDNLVFRLMGIGETLVAA